MPARAPGRGRLRRQVDADGRSVYIADYTDAQGKRRRQHVAGDRATAERVLARIIRERDLERQGLGGERGLDLAISVVVAQYLADLATRCKLRAVEETRRLLERIVSGLPAVLVRDVTKPRVVAWRQRRAKEGASNKTINNAVVALVAALNFAVSLGQLSALPLAGLKSLPITAAHQRRKPRALSESELVDLLEAAELYDRRTPEYVPRTPLLRFLVGTGARWGETVAIRWGDVDLEAGSVTLRAENTKTQTARTIPLHEDVIGALRALHAHACAHGRSVLAGDPVFCGPLGQPWTREARNFRRYLRALLKIARIPYRDATGRVVHVHALRHTFATRLARAGIGVATAQKLTGHRTAAMLLQVYTHVAADDAREAIRTLPPLRGAIQRDARRDAETA